MALHPELQASFSGGMVDTLSAGDDFKSNECELILNGRVDGDRAAAIGGSIRWHTSAVGSDRGLGAFYANINGVRTYLAFIGGSLYKATGAMPASVVPMPFSSVTSGLAARHMIGTQLVQSGTFYLIFANGATTTAYKYDGTTWGTITTPANFDFVEAHNDRLWGAAHLAAGGSRVYASKIGDFDTWSSPDGMELPVQTGEGDPRIMGLLSVGETLLVLKRNSASIIDGFGNASVIVAAGARGVSGSVGCIAPRTLIRVGDGACWLSDRGIEYWGGPGAPVRLLTDRRLGRFFRDSVARGEIATGGGTTYYKPFVPQAFFHASRNELWLTLPSVAYPTSVNGDLFNDVGVIVNLSTGACSRLAWPTTGDYPFSVDSWCFAETAIGADSPETPVLLPFALHYRDSPSAGCVAVVMDYGLKHGLSPDLSGGVDIDFRVRSRIFEHRQPTRRKRARIVRLTAASTAEQDVSVLIRSDGTDTAASAVTVPAASNDKPVRVRARKNSRGVGNQVEVRGAGGLAISAVELAAELIDQQT